MEVMVKDMHEVMIDIITEAKHKPYGWKSIIGQDRRTFSEDISIYHPDAGLYKIKRYAKSPFLYEGVGAKIARRIDDLPIGETSTQFEIVQVDIKRLIEGVLRSVDPVQAFLEAQSTDLEIDRVMSGPVRRSDALNTQLAQIFPDENKLLNQSYNKLTADRFKHYG